jgi:hypothetical protein
VRVDDPPPGRELQIDFGYLGMIPDGERRRKLHALVFTAVFSRYSVPDEPYRVPAWPEARVQRDFHVRAQNAFYSVPYGLIGQQVTVRAGDVLVKIYHRSQVVKVHPRQPAGGRSPDAADFPPGTGVCARRDVDRLQKMAAARGGAIGAYAARILDTDLPWTKMRAVYALIGLCKSYGNGPVEQACAAALELGVISVPKIRSIVEKGTGAQAERAAARSGQAGAAAGKALAARFARDPREFATATGARMRVLPGGDGTGG